MSEEGFVSPRGFTSRFNVGRALGQNIPNMAWTVVQWDVQIFDILTEMLIVAPWTFTPTQRGIYHLSAHVRFNNLPVGAICAMYYYLNGVAAIAGSYDQAANLNEDITLHIHGLEVLIPTDTVDVRVWHNSGIIRQIQGNQIESRWFGYREA